MVTTLLLLTALAAQAQDTGVVLLHGRVVSEAGASVDRVNVFILETLDGALTNAAGRFAIRTAHRGVATLVVRRVGFRPRQLDVSIPRTDPLVVTLEKQPVSIATARPSSGLVRPSARPPARSSASSCAIAGASCRCQSARSSDSRPRTTTSLW